mgnify:CR=1 FL=1
MSKFILFKMPRARKPDEFVVYPRGPEDHILKLQGDHYCLIVDMENNKILHSKRFNQYPTFLYCSIALGGGVIDLPNDLRLELEPYLEQPKNNGSVRLV